MLRVLTRIQFYEMVIIIISILQKRKLKYREIRNSPKVMELVKRKAQGLNPGGPGGMLLSSVPYCLGAVRAELTLLKTETIIRR